MKITKHGESSGLSVINHKLMNNDKSRQVNSCSSYQSQNDKLYICNIDKKKKVELNFYRTQVPEVEFVHAVSAGGSVKFLSAV